MNQQHVHIRSTRPKSGVITVKLDAIVPGYDITSLIKSGTNAFSAGVIEVMPGTGKIFTDQRGEFPVVSSR
eukprot:14147387-Ditylum_brightwellii.AAC.1